MTATYYGAQTERFTTTEAPTTSVAGSPTLLRRFIKTDLPAFVSREVRRESAARLAFMAR